MAQYAMITETGLNEVDNANINGIYIELAYYVPVYDYRIDETIDPTDTTVSATEIVTCTSADDLVPQGEVLWKLSGTDTYGLSTDRKYLYRTGSETVVVGSSDTTITNFAHRNTYTINQFKTSAISEHYTADTVDSPGNAGTEWVLSNAGYQILIPPTSADGYGPEDPEDPDMRFLYRGVTYQHVISAGDNSRGNFKVTMRIPDGQFKFNKVGLYGVKRSADGILIGDPFLFGQVIVGPEPQILQGKSVSNNNIGITEFTIEFQIELATTSNGFENIIYSTSGDYWVRTTNEQNGNYGLLYDGSIYVINRLGVDEIGGVIAGDPDRSVAKGMFGTFEYVNKPTTSAERDMPQLCLQYVASQGVDSQRIRTTMRTYERGHLEFDMYGACLSGDDVRYSLVPKYNGELGIGLKDRKWGHLFLHDNLEIYDYSTTALSGDENFTGFYTKIDATDKFAAFYNTDIQVGPYHNAAMVAYYDDGDYWYTKRQKNYNYFRGNISSYRPVAVSGDLEVSPASYDLLIRGLYDIGMVTLNSEYEDDPKFDSQSIMTKMWNTIFRTNNDFYELTKEKEELQKSITRNRNSFELENWSKRITEIDNILNTFDEDIVPYLGKDKDILMFAGGKIRTYGDIEPARSIYNSLGAEGHWWANLFVNKIRGTKGSDSDDRRQLTIDGDLVPNGDGRKIKNRQGGDKWKELNVDRIGNSDEYIRHSYLKLITTEEIEFDDGGIHLEKYSMEGKINNIGTEQEPVNTLWVVNLKIVGIDRTYEKINNVFIIPWGDFDFNDDSNHGPVKTDSDMGWNSGSWKLKHNNQDKRGSAITQVLRNGVRLCQNGGIKYLKGWIRFWSMRLHDNRGMAKALGFDSLNPENVPFGFQVRSGRNTYQAEFRQRKNGDKYYLDLYVNCIKNGKDALFNSNDVLIAYNNGSIDKELKFLTYGTVDEDIWKETT